ncbi:MAG: APC family permease, partial [Chloroflexi bacterium]|nr:APC family permease [Chloroflexota bacterium]
VLLPYRVEMALGVLVVISLINLRGIQESGTVMTIPVYLFLVTYLAMLAYGGIRTLTGSIVLQVTAAPLASQPVTLTLLLHTFAAGCTALTGIEAISNGVPSFKPPEAKNAGRTLIVMAILMGILFAGSIGLTQYLAVIPVPQETILSALARRLLGTSFAYFVVQASTMLILAVAANTSFAGFPRLAAILSRENFLPRSLNNLGDRLVFSNGILYLAAGTALLIILFRGDTHALIPLFAIGVFMAFTLSQAGMVMHWSRLRGKNWLSKAAINGIGTIVTGTTVLIIAVSRFSQGAWITIFLITLIVTVFLRIRRHYQSVARQLSLNGLPPSLLPPPTPRVVVPISGVHRGVVEAVNFSRSISDDVIALYIELEPGACKKVKKDWESWWPDVPLVVKPSPYRSIISPLIDFLDETDLEHNDGQQAIVILPEFIPVHWWQGLLHNQAGWLIKAALLYRRRQHGYQQVIIDVPYHLKK